MSEELLEQQADVLFRNIDGWEQSVIERIGKRIKNIGKMSVADVKMLNNIADVKGDMDEITKDLARVTGLNIKQIEQIYGDTLAEQHLANNPLYDYRGKQFVPFANNKELQAMVRAYAKTTAGTMLNLSMTKGLCVVDSNGRTVGLQRFYTDALDKAVMQVASGATDFHSAVRSTITALGGSGVRVDYGGLTRRLDTVVRQTVLWGAKQASNEYNEMIGEELGCDGIEIDYHRNPRPTHEFMQGKQYALGGEKVVNGKKFESADLALERLQDYGCLHFKTPIICGVSEPAYSDEELARLKKEDAKEYEIDGKTQNGYGWSQDMRKLETYMREQKRIKVAAQASGDKVLVKQCNERIKAAMAKYEQISDATGIRQDPSRFTIPRQPRTVKDALTSYNQSGIIKEKQYKKFDIEDQQGYDDWQKSYYDLNKPKLTANDIAAIKTYTDGSYSAINAATRFEKGSIPYNKVCKQYGEENLDKYKVISDSIAAAIEKFELNDDIICHRYVPSVDYITGKGSSLTDLQKSIGVEYTDKGFTSTCLFENLTKSFGGKTPIHLEIRVPKGSSGAYINEFSEKKNKEFEFLLNRGTKFKIINAGERKAVETKWIISDREWREIEVQEKFMILEVLS